MTATTTTIESEIEAYDAMRLELEAKHMGKWVLVHSGRLVSVHDTFEQTAQDAATRFGRDLGLIRQVGAPQFTLPASVMFHPVYA